MALREEEGKVGGVATEGYIEDGEGEREKRGREGRTE